MSDPFAVLGLGPDATLEDVRVARRRLARAAHPDHGGDEARMREINQAFDQAVRTILRPLAPAPATPRTSAAPAPRPTRQRVVFVQHDSPSFTLDAAPPEAFPALALVASRLGEVLVSDPPYLLEAHLDEPPCWCRLEFLPEAGGSTVSLTVAGPVDVDVVRDVWIAALNG